MSSTILIIDDMIQTLKYLSLYLSKDGFEVRTAKSYDEGFEVIGSANCVFLENNNIATVQLIKKNKTKKCLPFLGL